MLDDINDLGIFSDHTIDPKNHKKGSIPEIHISNVQNSWNQMKEVKNINIERIGIVIFKNLFKIDPSL